MLRNTDKDSSVDSEWSSNKNDNANNNESSLQIDKAMMCNDTENLNKEKIQLVFE